MRRRVGIAQALLNDPEILILDEPTAGLDPGERVRFRNLLSELAQDRIVLISTHIVSDVEYIATRHLLMKDGRLMASGTAQELTELVCGKVWTCRQKPEQVPALENRLQIIGLHNEEDGSVTVRYLASAPAVSGSCPAAARLEDVYLWLFPESADAVKEGGFHETVHSGTEADSEKPDFADSDGTGNPLFSGAGLAAVKLLLQHRHGCGRTGSHADRSGIGAV